MRNRNEKPTMRRYDLPPLDLLETFEAAARHSSFTRAAGELALTQSAVSRQIQALEDRLGVALFHRLHRALRLTAAGERLLIATGKALQQLHHVTEQIRREQRQKTVVLTTTPGFAGLWLIPLLAGYTAQRPQVDVRISAGNNIVNLERDGVDLAIRYSPQAQTGPVADRLFGEVTQPVCSPALCRDPARPLKHPEDLRHHLLLHLEFGPMSDWPMWLSAMNLEALEPAGALHFSHYDQMIQAAIGGQGIALGRLPLVAGLLRQRKLVVPFDASVASPRGYHLVRSKASAHKPEVQDFAAWLMQEAALESGVLAATASARRSTTAAPRRAHG
jgi:LysR family transcriptional regulator, glycine cleavage system transcriptional activator